jgi:hypothetical protein
MLLLEGNDTVSSASFYKSMEDASFVSHTDKWDPAMVEAQKFRARHTRERTLEIAR